MYAPKLGFIEVIGGAVDLVQDVGQIFGVGGDDAKRKAAIDRRKALALQGDNGSLAVLKCWAGLPTPELNQFPDLAKDVGVNASGSNCGMATTAAKQYARQAYEEVLAVRAGRPISTTPYTPGGTTYPTTYPTSTTYPTTYNPLSSSGGVSPLVIGGAALVAILLLGKKRS